MKIIFTALMLTACCTPAAAQTNETYAPGIASLQVMAGERWMSLPVIRLDADGPGDRVNISFDDLTHAYRRYTYSIEHCEADWTASDQIFTSDYVEGFSEGNTIGPGEESVNTDTLYTHYRLTIPNAECSLKMSGNYRLTVYDEDDGHRPVLSACFMVAETAASVGLNVTPNTDSGDAEPPVGQCPGERQPTVCHGRRAALGALPRPDIRGRQRVPQV